MTNFFKFEPSSSINCRVNAIATLPEEEVFTHSFKLKRKSELNKIIVDASNKPDYLAINIYFDTLRSWYSPKKIHRVDGTITHISKLKTKGIYLSNKKLAASYGCSTETIRKKLVKLEKLGLIQRSFQHRSNAVTNSYNQLIVYVWKITPHFFNEFGINREEVSNLVPQTNHKYIAEKYNIDYNSQPQSDKDIGGRGGIHKIEGTKKLIELFSKEKNRSIESNVLESNFEDKESSSSNNTSSLSENKTKHLKDFYPLKKEDCNLLQSLSGREFGLTAMNEILKDMSKRLTDKIFYSKKGFIAYMSKAFQYEMRDAVKTNNETFKIRSNYSEEEINTHKQEQFLSEIESSIQVNPECHLKKKLASVLERKTAYDLLSNYKSSERVGDVYRFYLAKQLQIGEMDKQIILSQVKATQERLGDSGDIEYIEKIEFIFDKQHLLNTVKRKVKIEPDIPKNIWGEIRKELIKKNGREIDKFWFEDIDYEENKERRTIKLKANSEFKQDWIKEKYLDDIVLAARTKNYKLEAIEC